MNRQVRLLMTPEGVALPFLLAPVGDRAVAFVLDCMLVLVATVSLVGVLGIASLVVGEVALASFLLVSFLLRTFYFAAFEWLGDGRTPGKRVLRLRVIDRGGGPLTGEAVFARNLSREIEVFLPLVALLAPQTLAPDVPPAARVVACVWVAALVMLPLLAPDRMRAGDLLAGTLVVRMPRAPLLPDLSADAPAGAGALTFTPQQLDLYGVYELQVLETLLRGQAPDRRVLLEAIAQKVQAKIGWEGAADAEEFLTAFYAAQRGRLEQRMLVGQRRERKQDPAAAARERPSRKP